MIEKERTAKDYQAEAKIEWERKTTRELLSEVESRMRGCNKPNCYACAHTDALADVLRERLEGYYGYRKEQVQERGR